MLMIQESNGNLGDITAEILQVWKAESSENNNGATVVLNRQSMSPACHLDLLADNQVSSIPISLFLMDSFKNPFYHVLMNTMATKSVIICFDCISLQ